MRRLVSTMTLSVVALWAASVTAQGRNFAGSWVIDAERTAAAATSGTVLAAGARSGGGGGGRGGFGGGGAVAAAPSPGAGGFAGGGGGGRARGPAVAGPMTVAMDATSFTVGSGTASTTYRLDGLASTVQTSGGSVTAKATWKGDRLVIETNADGANGPVVTTATWYLDGESLVRETSTPAPDGQEIVRTTFYKKAS